ncbi:MAG: type II toxin-antitoxin system VapC family toxin [Actinomycetota bacterium]|nr:type II toxin-antitoxin system VapC family toxin [Actinomycetota bacterium]
MALIHLDAGVVIGFLDAEDTHHDASRAVLEEALRSGHRLAMASSAFAECLVGPARRSEAAVGTVRDLFDRFPITVLPLTAETAVVAARLRARRPAVRLPDAIVIATAIEHEADQLVTTDRKWPSARVLKLAVVVRHM